MRRVETWVCIGIDLLLLAAAFVAGFSCQGKVATERGISAVACPPSDCADIEAQIDQCYAELNRTRCDRASGDFADEVSAL